MNDIAKQLQLLQEDGSVIFIENNERKNEITIFVYYEYENKYQKCAINYITNALLRIGYTITHLTQNVLAFCVTEEDRKVIKSKIKGVKEEVIF